MKKHLKNYLLLILFINLSISYSIHDAVGENGIVVSSKYHASGQVRGFGTMHTSSDFGYYFEREGLISLFGNEKELDKADAHPYGARPFKRKNYINKFLTLTDGIIDKKESDRFLKSVQNLKNLKPGQLDKLNIVVRKSKLKRNLKKGIF